MRQCKQASLFVQSLNGRPLCCWIGRPFLVRADRDTLYSNDSHVIYTFLAAWQSRSFSLVRLGLNLASLSVEFKIDIAHARCIPLGV